MNIHAFIQPLNPYASPYKLNHSKALLYHDA